jgi:uncharacterized repeat protein (TIGR03833 family)
MFNFIISNTFLFVRKLQIKLNPNKSFSGMMLISSQKCITLTKQNMIMKGQNRSDIKIGAEVSIVLKEDQGSGSLTDGVVEAILTKSLYHPHGIKVRLESGDVGRVKKVKPKADM